MIMPGLGGTDVVGRMVTVQEDLPGDVDGILDAVRRIIMMGEIKRIVIQDDEPITYQRFVHQGETVRPSESTASFAELSLLDVVRQVQMEEYSTQHKVSVCASQLVHMVAYLEMDGWVFTHLLVGENTRFWEWLDIPDMVAKRLPRFLGARIEREKTLPAGVFIMCGSKSRGATVAEIGFALKGNIDECAAP